MSFSASTCLTNTGTTTLSSTLTIYSNPISPTSPGTYVTTVPTTDITGGNCPYTFEVPDGTTSVRLSDPITGCYCDIPVSDNDLCTTCDLNFNTFTSPSVGNIVAGDITGTCDASVSNYLIYWYDVTDPLTPIFKFSSGKGSMFAPYDNVHPLTGTSSVLATSGTYDAILEKIELNGVVFSRTGGTGTVLADLDCLPSIINGDPFEISALNCSNGGDSSNLPQYEHRFAYSATTGGNLPTPLSTTFELSANTNYFVWKFKGETVPDKIKFTFIGSSYTEPILLEYWEVGDLAGYTNNYSNNVYPKSADTTDYFYKATCLTGLTVNEGDNIFIEITPSTANTQTSWTFYCGCLDTFDCDGICQPPSATTVSGTTSYQFPIIGSTITGVTGSCDTIVIYYSLSGCSAGSFTGNSFIDYTNLYTTNSTGIITLNSGTLYLSGTTCGIQGNGCAALTCLNNGSTITYEKSPGLFKVTSNSDSTISTIYSDYLSCMIPKISPFSGDNTNVEYYRYMQFSYPNSVGTTPCGDGTTDRSIYIHQSSVITTGTTGLGDYYLEMTMPTISANTTFTSCDVGCTNSVNGVVSTVNSSSTGATGNYTGTTTVGSLYDNSFKFMFRVNVSTLPNSASTTPNQINISNFQNETYPSTGTTETGYTIVPSYSAVTCPNILNTFRSSTIGPSAYEYLKVYSYYNIQLFDPLDFKNFRIYASEINSSGQVNNSIITLVYEWSGGTNTYSNPEYIL